MEASKRNDDVRKRHKKPEQLEQITSFLLKHILVISLFFSRLLVQKLDSIKTYIKISREMMMLEKGLKSQKV